MSSQEEKEDSSIELTAECLCKANIFTTRVPRSQLPLEAVFCHCDSCRHVTGAMHSSEIMWSSSSAIQPSSSGLKRYAFSERLGLLFCRVCGTPMFFESAKPTAAAGGKEGLEYGVFTGVLKNIDLGQNNLLFKITDHVFVRDTLDGGATPWLCDTNDEAAPRLWVGGRGKSELWTSPPPPQPQPQPQPQSQPPSTSSQGKEDDESKDDIYSIPVRCKCSGVDLLLRPSTVAFAKEKEEEQQQDENKKLLLPWFIDPVTRRSHADYDACDSCRLACGADVLNWTFCLLRHLSFAPSPNNNNSTSNTLPLPHTTTELKALIPSSTSPSPTEEEVEKKTPYYGTLTYYASSPDVQRYFCARCSATVFYACDDRPDMVDLAAGLLCTTDRKGTGTGARAEDLLSWDFGGTMAWRTDAAGGWRERYISRIEDAAERWRVERGVPKNWRRVQKEEADGKKE
ncbi:hypothetical protein F5Y17DRAFT_460425 [Xylariaceae sp. FL0594]|nr:hypothetical protein F5Y17DRAFT_460425 [Xylariaceae sp. FL0594]